MQLKNEIIIFIRLHYYITLLHYSKTYLLFLTILA
jgi:hypothetical protein